MKITTLLFLVAFSAGCASMDKAISGSSSMPTDQQRVEIVKQYPDLTSAQKAKFIKGEPFVGMTQEQLNACLGSEPTKTQQKVDAMGSHNVELYSARVGNWKTGVVTKYYRADLVEGKLVEFHELDKYAGSFDNL